MTRIAENQIARSLLTDISNNLNQVSKYSNELSSGLKVSNPGDSKFASTIASYQAMLQRIDGQKTRISAVTAQISFQNDVVSQANDLLVSASELAAQGANESVGAEVRSQLSKEVFALRDQLVTLANSKYQDKYIYGGTIDSAPPYNATTYNPPASGSAAQRYTYYDTTAKPASVKLKTVNLTDQVSLVVNTPGNQVFDHAIQALERLGRALAGYSTNPASGTPNGTGTQYDLTTQFAQQTADISNAMNLLNTARQNDIMPEEVSLGSKLKRLDAASSLLGLTKQDAQTVLSNLQDSDYATSATNLTQAQNALEASYTVSSRILKLSVLDYL